MPKVSYRTSGLKQTQSTQKRLPKKRQQEKKNQLRCMRKHCKKTFTKQNQLQKHKQHITEKKLNNLYNLDPEGPIDCRRMQYKGTPTHEQTQVHGLIKYNTTKQKWECTQCDYMVKPQDQGNIIQHAIKAHKQNTYANYHPKILNTQEKHIVQTRINTLNVKNQVNTTPLPQINKETIYTQTEKIKNITKHYGNE